MHEVETRFPHGFLICERRVCREEIQVHYERMEGKS